MLNFPVSGRKKLYQRQKIHGGEVLIGQLPPFTPLKTLKLLNSSRNVEKFLRIYLDWGYFKCHDTKEICNGYDTNQAD